jgi:hypothetical protein
MKNLIAILIVTSFLGCNKDEVPPQINASWIEDIVFIQKELPVKHINLFSKISEQEFNSEIKILIEEAPNLEENEIICGLMKIFANIGDSHTGLHFEANIMRFNIAPVKYELFDDGIYIVESIESGRPYLKQKVEAINNVSLEIIRDSLAKIIPHENDYFVNSAFPIFLRLFELLEALKMTDSKNSYTLNLENGENILIRGSTSTDTNVSCYEPDKTPLYLVNEDINYSYKLIEDNIVYLQYNKCFDIPDNPFSNFNQNMFKELENQNIDKFIIDLRLNTGGISWIISPLIEELKKHEELAGKIYVCISGKTFSSGLLNAIQLKEELDAILVGQPTGGKPNHFGDVQELILPNSKLIIRFSTKYFTLYPGNDINTLEPDYYVENNSYDSFSGIDSYVEFIKSH